MNCNESARKAWKIKYDYSQDFLVVQWLRLQDPNIGNRGLIPGQELGCCMLWPKKKACLQIAMCNYLSLFPPPKKTKFKGINERIQFIYIKGFLQIAI